MTANSDKANRAKRTNSMNSPNLLIDRNPTILIVAPYIYPLFKKNVGIPFGGAEVQLFLLMKELIKISHPNINIYIITGKKKLKFPYTENFGNLNVIVSQPLNNNKIFNIFKRPINLFLNLIKSKPDVIIQRVGGIETGICALYATIFNKTFIYSIAHERDLKKKGRKGLLRLFYNFGLSNADYIIAQSNEQKKLLKKWKKKKEPRTLVIKSGYEIERPSINKKNSILWVGRGIKWKRGELFINLAEIFSEKDFIMICNKRKGYYDYWNQLKSKSEDISNLRFIERVPFSKIDKYFKEAKVFVNTSIKEGFPNTFIQSFKNRTPILSLNVDPDNVIKKNKCGFYCDNDLDKLRHHLRELLENEELYETYSHNAYQYVKTNHDIKKTSEKWKKLISLIIGH